MNSTSNQKGVAYFLSLDTRKGVPRQNWTKLLIDKQIVEAVHDIAYAVPLYDRDVPDFEFKWGPSHRQPSIKTLSENEIDPEEYVLQWDTDSAGVDSYDLDDGDTNELILPAEPEFFQAIIEDNQCEAIEGKTMVIVY